MFVHEFDDEPNNLGEKQLSRNPKETLGTEMRCLKINWMMRLKILKRSNFNKSRKS